MVPLVMAGGKWEKKVPSGASEPEAGWKKGLTRLRNPKKNANPDTALYSSESLVHTHLM